jgi:hypothetical protein
LGSLGQSPLSRDAHLITIIESLGQGRKSKLSLPSSASRMEMAQLLKS